MKRWPDARIVHRLDQAISGLMVLARSCRPARAGPGLRPAARAQALRGHRPWTRTESRWRRWLGRHRSAPRPRLAAPPAQQGGPAPGQTQPHALAGAGARHRQQHLAAGTRADRWTFSPVARAPAGHRPSDRWLCALRPARFNHASDAACLRTRPAPPIDRRATTGLPQSRAVLTDEASRAGCSCFYSRLPTSSRWQNYPACTKGAGVTVEPRSDNWMHLPAALTGVFNRRFRVEPLRHLAFVCKEPS